MGAVGVLAGCVLFCVALSVSVFSDVSAQSGLLWRCWLKCTCLRIFLTVLSTARYLIDIIYLDSRTLSPVPVQWPSKAKSMSKACKISLNEGQYVICPFKCKIIGTAKGCARVRASIHTLLTTFDNEEWQIIILVVNHLDSRLKYTDFFAASCGPIGDFTNIKKLDEGYAMSRQMKHYNFPIRNFDGTFYVQVHPFDPEYFAVKVHPTGALLFTPYHLQLTLLQHIIIQSPFLKRPVLFLSDFPKYWLEDDGAMCLRNSHRWKLADKIEWLRIRGLHSVPNSIKADIGDLVYNGPSSKASDDPAVLNKPPGRFVFNASGRASNDPPPGL